MDVVKGGIARPGPGGTEAERARRYLLGELSQNERTRLDAQFERDAEARALVEQVEEALIADYVSDRLDARSRGGFERDYLANARNREKVEIARRLGLGAGGAAPVRRRSQAFRVGGWLALVAAVLLNVWLLNYAKQRGQQLPAPGSSSFLASGGSASTGPTLSTSATSSAPSSSSGPSFSTSPSRPASSGSSGVRTSAPGQRIVPWSLAPIEIRAVTATTTLALPAEAEILALSLQGDASASAPLGTAQVRVETANGREIWRGDALSARVRRDGVLAYVEIPTARLGVVGDLTVILFVTSARGEQSRARYLLRVAR
jgi:hypothetical protein